ncbi:MAG: hypothetical protein CYG60_15370 [Actinobacteria bacterium]|nr:MAG: hypothetical protein CYG60_15370 [Actinomycetota bacterium]
MRRWHGREDAVHVRYEDLRRDPAGELYRMVKELTDNPISLERAQEIADEFSFERQAGRKTGEENRRSFLRKGVVGEWKERFSPEARRVFDRYAGEELVLLGYEKDRSWVEGGASS